MDGREASWLRDQAEACVARGDYATAFRYYDELVHQVPLDTHANQRLGELALALGDRATAAAHFRAAAFVLGAQGQLLKAIAACHAVLDIEPEHSETQKMLASFYARQEDSPASVEPTAPAMAPSGGALTDGLTGQPLENAAGGIDQIIVSLDEDLAREEMAAAEHELKLERPVPPVLADGPVSPDEAPVIFARRSLSNHRRMVAIPRMPLFSGLPAEALEKLIGRLAVEKRQPDEDVIREGERGESLYALVSGQVAVSRQGQLLAVLEAGQFFGELAVITQDPRSATVTVTEPAELLRLDRELISDVVLEYPAVLMTLLGFVRARLVSLLLHTSPLFGVLDPEERRALAGEFQVRQVNAGGVVVRQGEPAQALHVVMAGQFSVEVRGHQQPVSTLQAGDVFGELSLLGASAALATVRAERRGWLLALPRERFHHVVIPRPPLMAYLADLGQRRERRLAELVTEPGPANTPDRLAVS
jgi:CRP-like cAMP-binding protein